MSNSAEPATGLLIESDAESEAGRKTSGSGCEGRGSSGTAGAARDGEGRGAAETGHGMRTASTTIASSTTARARNREHESESRAPVGFGCGCGGGGGVCGNCGGEDRTGGAAAEVEVSEEVAVDGDDRTQRALHPARTSIRIDEVSAFIVINSEQTALRFLVIAY